MEEHICDTGLVIKKTRFSDSKVFIHFLTKNNGILTTVISLSSRPKTSAPLYGVDAFSFFEIEGTIKTNYKGATRLALPQLTPMYEFNKIPLRYREFLFACVWCEILSHTNAHGDDTRTLYDCSVYLRCMCFGDQSPALGHAYVLFRYLKECRILFDYIRCDRCGSPTFKEKDRVARYHKAQYIYNQNHSITCDRCAVAPYFLSSSDIKICRLFDDLPETPKTFPTIPHPYLVAYVRSLIHYIKLMLGTNLKSESQYIGSINAEYDV